MTLGQAAYRGIAKLRRPSWEPSKSIELQFDYDADGNRCGTVGPHVKFRDADGKEEDVFILNFNEEDDWEAAPE